MTAATIATYIGPRRTTERRAAHSASRITNGIDRCLAVLTADCGKDEILRIADEIRAARTAPPDPLLTPIGKRLERRLLRAAALEFALREIDVPAGWDEVPRRITDRAGRYSIVSGGGWLPNDRRGQSYLRAVSYLVRTDDGHRIAARVPSTVRTVAAALAWLKPPAIRAAEAEGLPVRRQGEIWFRPMPSPEHDMTALAGTDHRARPRKGGGLKITHPAHRSLTLPGRYRWVAFASSAVTQSDHGADAA